MLGAMPVDTASYRAEFRPRIPRWYRGWPHFVSTNALLGGLTLYLLTRIRGLRAAELLVVPVGFLVANLVEYVAHRYPLHRPMPLLKYAYKAHGVQHHRFFTGDSEANMTTSDPHDFAVVLFGPLSQGILIFGAGLPAALVIGALLGRNAALLFGATAVFYFLLYEWLHLLYHLPSSNPLTKLPGLGALQRHHLRHHELRLMSKWNFNITFPIFDAVFGTTWKPGRSPSQQPAGLQPPASEIR